MKLTAGTVAAILLTSVGCGGSNNNPPATPSQTTSATPDTSQSDHTRQELMRVEQERDQARQELANERAMNEQQKQRLDAQMMAMKERDALEIRAFEAVDKADAQLHQMDDAIKHAKTQAEKKDLQTAMKDLHEKKMQLEASARRIRGKAAGEWDQFKARLDADIKSIEQSLSMPETQKK